MPVYELPLTENFFLRCKLMGFATLGDVVDTPVNVLLRKEDFTYEWLGELAKYLTSQNLLHRLQPITENSFY